MYIYRVMVYNAARLKENGQPFVAQVLTLPQSFLPCVLGIPSGKV